MSSGGKTSILVIGCGSIGERHLRCFLQTGRVEATACDSSAALRTKMAEAYGVPVVSDWEAAVTSGKHAAAIVCTPAPLHVPMATKILGAGLHALVEKPLSHSLAGVDGLLEAHRRSGRQAAVGYVLHVYPVLAQSRAFLASGELGRPLQASVVSGQPFHKLRPGYAQTYYRDRAMGGGAIQDALTHSVNWVESVIGPVDSVMCDCAHLALPGVDVEDTVHVSTRHGGVLANFTLNQFQPANESTITINAERGMVKIETHRRRWGVYRENATDWTWHDCEALERDTPFIAQANAFLDQIGGAPARLCSLAAAARTLRFNLAALQSAASGARVRCADLS